MSEPAKPHQAKKPHFLRSGRIFGIRLADVFAERRRAGRTFTVGLIVLMLIQFPRIEQSFLGEPDRLMMEMAFKLRADVVTGKADPILFLDIDDRTLSEATGETLKPFAAPVATVPRAMIATLLDFIRTSPPQTVPKVVVVDVDVAAPASDGKVGTEKLKAALAAWAKSPTTPNLIIAREAYPPQTLGMQGDLRILPDTPYDDVVRPAPNIYWSTVKVLADSNGVTREFLPYECIRSSAGQGPLYSAALLAYDFMETNKTAAERAPVRHWMDEARPNCQGPHPTGPDHGEKINFHLSLDLDSQDRVWPNVAKDWPGFRICGGSNVAVVRRQSVADIVAAMQGGGDISHDMLCQRMVIVGGTNGVAGDFVQTPLTEMNGSMVLANAARGLELSGGGLRSIPLLLQILVLLIVTLAISAGAAATSHARHHYTRMRAKGAEHGILKRLAILPLNPMILNGTIALAAHWLGVGLLCLSLNFGVWSFLSAPVFAAAITETLQEFTDEPEPS